MKIACCVLLLAGFSGCKNMVAPRPSAQVDPLARADTSREAVRRERLRFLESETEARAKSYEKKGYSPQDARALASVEYFRAGK